MTNAKRYTFFLALTFIVPLSYWKQLENKQEMKHSRFMQWNNCIN
jgi:hypothetical protein